MWARDTSRRFRISRRNYRQMLLQAETDGAASPATAEPATPAAA